MKKILLLIIIVAVAFACNKDKFQTKPQIKIVSTNTDVVPINGTLRVVLEFTDKEGDVSDSIIVVRERLNLNGQITAPSIAMGIPSFPENQQGEIAIDLPYQNGPTALISGFQAITIPGTGNPPSKEPDTLRLKFVVRDAAGNKSDTASLGVIAIR
jgi:hypothetical protein